MNETPKGLVDRVNPDRREAVKKMLRTTAFTIPVVSSFTLGGLAIGAARPAFAGNGS